ncbi:MAG TPA: PDZ domain-containing protein [Longimicrobiales bacterium]|nr:PDZ domain-containing protein [Longimicrobiales bacterium]
MTRFAMRAGGAGVAALLGLALLGPTAAEAQRTEREDRERDLTVHLRDAEGRLRELMSTYELRLSRAQLGVSIEDDDLGARVSSVLEDGPAEEAGLREGDVIVALDGTDLGSSIEDEDEDEDWGPTRRLMRLMADVEPGDDVRVDYLRDGRRQSVIVTARRRGGVFVTRGVPLGGAFRVDGEPGGAWRFAMFGGEFRGAKLADVNAGLGSYFGVDSGALVLDVDDDANDLGLRPGDVIVEIGGRKVEDSSDAYRILGSYERGERLRVVVVRERGRVTLETTTD